MRERVMRSCMMSMEPTITSNNPGSGPAFVRSEAM
jgi:hypothetical protein